MVAPDLLEDQHVLDLGCGSGMDCYILAKMVGPSGYVTGVDMTEEQVRKYNYIQNDPNLHADNWYFRDVSDEDVLYFTILNIGL